MILYCSLFQFSRNNTNKGNFLYSNSGITEEQKVYIFESLQNIGFYSQSFEKFQEELNILINQIRIKTPDSFLSPNEIQIFNKLKTIKKINLKDYLDKIVNEEKLPKYIKEVIKNFANTLEPSKNENEEISNKDISKLKEIIARKRIKTELRMMQGSNELLLNILNMKKHQESIFKDLMKIEAFLEKRRKKQIIFKVNKHYRIFELINKREKKLQNKNARKRKKERQKNYRTKS